MCFLALFSPDKNDAGKGLSEEWIPIPFGSFGSFGGYQPRRTFHKSGKASVERKCQFCMFRL